MKGLPIQLPTLQDGAIGFTACQGSVHLENIRVAQGATPQGVHMPYGPAVLADACAMVTVNNCNLKGAPALDVRNRSHVTASGCTLRGQDATLFGLSFSYSVEAVHVENASLTLTGGQATGGDGISGVEAGSAVSAAGSGSSTHASVA